MWSHNNNTRRCVQSSIIAMALYVAPTAAQYGQQDQADRLVASAQDYRMSVRESECDRLLNVDIRTRSADVLSPQSERLRGILAVARAVLTYECPNLRGFQVHGHDDTSGVTRLSGRALAKDNWEFTSHYYDDDQTSSQPALTTSEQFSVANLQVGMGLAEARRVLRDIYQDSRYRDGRRVLVAGTEGCGSRRARLQARRSAQNQHCVRAWFTNEREPRLKRLVLVQRVEGDQRTEGVRTLSQRFGRPALRSYHDPSKQHADANFGEVTRLRWGQQVSEGKNGKGTHELEADLVSNPYSTELILRLQSPSIKDNVSNTNDSPFIY